MCSLPFSLLSNLLVSHDSFKELKTNIGGHKDGAQPYFRQPPVLSGVSPLSTINCQLSTIISHKEHKDGAQPYFRQPFVLSGVRQLLVSSFYLLVLFPTKQTRDGKIEIMTPLSTINCQLSTIISHKDHKEHKDGAQSFFRSHLYCPA